MMYLYTYRQNRTDTLPCMSDSLLPRTSGVHSRLSARGLSVRTRSGPTLLHPCDILWKPGCLVGVMGPSGAGKTTLVEALCGLSPHNVTGDVMVNGRLASAASRCRLVSFTATAPCLVEELPLRGNVTYERHALGVSEEQIATRCAQLGLDRNVEVPVGRLSTGERKRVQVLLELLHQSSDILVMDEPTTGLADSDAIALVEVLRRVADCGVTVALVIHQPRPEVQRLLDSVLLVSRGRVVANDTVANTVALLPPCPTSTAPLHWLLDSLATDPDRTEASLLRGYHPCVAAPLTDSVVRPPPLPSSCRQFHALFVQHAAFWWAGRRSIWGVFLLQSMIGLALIQMGNPGRDYDAVCFKCVLSMICFFNVITHIGITQQYTSIHRVRLRDNRCGRTTPAVVTCVEVVVPFIGHLVGLPVITAALLWIFDFEPLVWRLATVLTMLVWVSVATQHAVKWSQSLHSFHPCAAILLMMLASSNGVFTVYEDLAWWARPLLVCNPMFYLLQFLLSSVLGDDFDADADPSQCVTGVAVWGLAMAVIGVVGQYWSRPGVWTPRPCWRTATKELTNASVALTSVGSI